MPQRKRVARKNIKTNRIYKEITMLRLYRNNTEVFITEQVIPSYDLPKCAVLSRVADTINESVLDNLGPYQVKRGKTLDVKEDITVTAILVDPDVIDRLRETLPGRELVEATWPIHSWGA